MLVGDQNGSNTVERSLGLGPRPRIDDNCPIAIVNAHARMSELGDDLRHSVTNRDDRRQAHSIEIGNGLTFLQKNQRVGSIFPYSATWANRALG